MDYTSNGKNGETILMKKFLMILMFLLGLFAGMDALYVKVGPIDMTIFTGLLMIIIITKMVVDPQIYFHKDKALTIYFCITIVSSIFSFVNVPEEWYKSNIVNLASTLVGIIGLWFLFNDEKKYICAELFLKGFKINCIIQILWAIMQFIMCEFLNLSLNSLCGFRKSRSGLTLAEQVSGLGWERASLCLTMAYAVALYNNVWVKLVAVFIAVICQSRSGLILVLLVILMSLDWQKIKRISYNKLVKSILIFFVICLLVISNLNFIIKLVTSVYMRFTNLDKEASAMGHMSYYRQFLSIIKQCSLGQVLFGFGGASSGYPYTKFYNRFTELEKGWTVESSWLSMFWASGALGFTAFQYWFLGKMNYFRKNNKVVFSLLFAILIGGIGYTLLPTWSEITIIFIVKVYEEKKCFIKQGKSVFRTNYLKA